MGVEVSQLEAQPSLYLMKALKEMLDQWFIGNRERSGYGLPQFFHDFSETHSKDDSRTTYQARCWPDLLNAGQRLSWKKQKYSPASVSLFQCGDPAGV